MHMNHMAPILWYRVFSLYFTENLNTMAML